jgi:glycosyltransferase
MKISIITATYNSAKTIGDTLESINKQTYKNIEHIIIDGKSKDDTLRIIETFDHDRIVISESDKGIYDAMNKGLKIATGDVIGILNSDDLYYDNFVIEKIMNSFKEDQNIDIIFGNLVYVSKDDTNCVIRKWESKNYYQKFFEHGNVPPHPSLFLKSKIYKQVGYFNLKYSLAADYEFMLRLFKKFNFKSNYISTIIVKMRLGGASNKSIKNIILGNKEIFSAWKDNGLKAPFLLMPIRILKRLTQFI